MKIQTTVTVNELVEVDIELPYYCKSGNTFYAVESEDYTVLVINETFYSLVQFTPTEWQTKKIAEGVAVTKDEFDAARREALRKVSYQIREEVAA